MFPHIVDLEIMACSSLPFKLQPQSYNSHQHIALSIFALDSLCFGKPVSVPFPSEAIVPSCQVGNARSIDTARVEVARAVDTVVGLNKHGAHPTYELAVSENSRLCSNVYIWYTKICYSPASGPIDPRVCHGIVQQPPFVMSMCWHRFDGVQLL